MDPKFDTGTRTWNVKLSTSKTLYGLIYYTFLKTVSITQSHIRIVMYGKLQYKIKVITWKQFMHDPFWV